MLLYRIGPEGFYASTDEEGVLRVLHSDPFEVRPGGWELGRALGDGPRGLLAPVVPGKIVGVGRNYRAHAEELGNAVPDEPVLFLKAPSSVIGPRSPVVLPPESDRVEFEGEIAVVLRHRLQRAEPEQARHAILGITCACDVTARDLQRRDPTFARAKSFDTFCPLGPAIQVEPDLDDLEVVTRVNGDERQRAHCRDMLFGHRRPAELRFADDDPRAGRRDSHRHAGGGRTAGRRRRPGGRGERRRGAREPGRGLEAVVTRRVIWAFVAAAATVLVLIAWRDFFPRHAVIVGLGVAALVYSILRTTERLKSLHRK